MKVNNEITLRIQGDMEQFKQNLKDKGYEEKGHFILYDTFMIPGIACFLFAFSVFAIKNWGL